MLSSEPEENLDRAQSSSGGETADLKPGDQVAAGVDLGGFLKGKIPAGTPGVVDEVETGSGDARYKVTFTIEHDDLLMPHKTTLQQLTEDDLRTS